MNIWQSYQQECGCFMNFVRLANRLLEDEESARDNQVLACNFAKYLPILKLCFTDRLNNQPFFFVINTPPHLKYVVTLP